MTEETNPAAAGDAVVNEAAPLPLPEEKAEVKEAEMENSAEESRRTEPDPDAKVETKVEAGFAGSVSFKEESNLVADLTGAEKKAFDELRQLVLAAIANNEFSLPSPPPLPPSSPTPAAAPEDPAPIPAETKESADPAEPKEKTVEVVEENNAKTVEAIEETVVAAPAEEENAAETPAPPAVTAEKEEVLIWGVPLVGDKRSDTVLLKFLRARDFKPKEAMAMLKSTVLWRKHFGIEKLLEEKGDLGLPEMDKVVFSSGVDREGHPVCYNVYGEFQNKDLYEKAFADEEKRLNFLKWRIRYLEKGIREELDFAPGGVCSMVQVTDFKNLPPVLGKHRQVTKQAVTLLQDNYPEFIAKKVFINVPWWYVAVNRMMSPFLTKRTESKFVFAGPAKSAETLFRYIAPEQIPVQFGGLRKENDTNFTTSDVVSVLTVKPASKQTVDIPASENQIIVWEVRAIGSNVNYTSEFVPSAEGAYTIIVQKPRKLSSADDQPIVSDAFKVREPGKLILNIDNPTSKKKIFLYRFKFLSSQTETC